MFGRAKKEITIHKKCQSNIWTVEVDQFQIEQVLLNLYVNAWQAMSGTGELYIQTENIMLNDKYVKPYRIASGKYVKISVTDTGTGIDETIQHRIFDPFFTTKEISRGTGLGLASAYGIIKNHGGIINSISKKGEGATFNIFLPASEKKIFKEKMPQKDILKGSETVLFVDDEDIIIDVGRDLLKKLGYDVLTAKGGIEAVEIYKTNPKKIDIVILDMIMPEMGGGDTYEKLRDVDPGVKVLLSSGYSIDGQASKILSRGCDGFIQKPFDIKSLSLEIRKILDNTIKTAADF
jgi:CheY-like chemotaxis protein